MSWFDDPRMLAPARAVRTDRSDGSIVLQSPESLEPFARCVGEWVEQWSCDTPDAIALAERDATGSWRTLSWRELRVAIGAIAQSLLDLQLPSGKPVVILSDNSVDHALLSLAAMHVGRPACAVSSAYSRLATDYTKLKGMLQALDPAMVYASDAAVYGRAMRECVDGAVMVVGIGADQVPGALRFDALLQTVETPAVMQAFEDISPDDHAKYLLTSGSTGHPKVVINTHRMLCANQQMIGQAWRFLDHEKPVLVDWLPWSHTFGGNHNFNMVLRNGGTLYIDEGRPAPGLVDKTVRNLREVRPTMHFNVPRGMDMLLPFLEQDDALARDFFSRLRMVFYAGAALPQATWDRLEAVARKVREEPVWFTTSWGSTETAPAVTSAHWRLDRAGVIGLPLPGMQLKFVPSGAKLEMRVRGVSVFPGYRDAPELTAQAFDEEGFYKIGDAGRFLDDSQAERGVVFDGRVAEDFKLGSGTWVSVGMLRVKLLSALAPLAQDAVITGHERDEVGALIFPTPQAGQLAPQALADRVREVLRDMRRAGGGSSTCPTRVLFLAGPPDPAAGEITDKGYVNQRASLAHRAVEVQALYAVPDDPRVIVAD